MYTFNPTAQQAALLQQIAARESGGNYTATITQANCDAMMGAPNSVCTASGAYMFIDSTWQSVSQQTGVPFYATAASAPAWVQDINALWLLRNVGPNSTASWGASAPGGAYPAIDLSATAAAVSAGGDGLLANLSGDAAATPTADILSQLQTAGIDLTDPATLFVIALGVGAVVYALAD